jgi:four helix bundle protein
MAGWKDFREIVAWQRAESMKLRVYAFLERPKVRRDFRYCEQLREAARSAPANIAEGFGRFGNKEFARFVRIARGSEMEVLNHFVDAKDQRLLTDDELCVEEHFIRGALKAAAGLIQHLESTPDPPRPKKNPEPNRT